jgi:hypothetical protein
MPRIFLSYRRADSADIVGRIDDRLATHFGRECVFRDTESINLGDDFPERILREIHLADIVLIIIGEGWAEIKSDDGIKRLSNENDFVRIEVETALRRVDSNVRVIPVLVNGASMPSEDELPSTLRSLVNYTATSVRNEPDFGKDIDTLINKIEHHKKAKFEWGRHIISKLGSSIRGMPQFAKWMAAVFMALVGIAGVIFTYLDLPQEQKDAIWEWVCGITNCGTSTDLKSGVSSFSFAAEKAALNINLGDIAQDPRGLTVGPSREGIVIWGYSAVGSGLFALDVATGKSVELWDPKGNGDPRVFPISKLFDNALTTALHFDGEWLWVGDSRNGRLIALDPLTLELIMVHDLNNSGNPVGFVNTGNILWVILQNTNEVVGLQIDHNAQTVSSHCSKGTIELSGTPTLITNTGLTRIWVATYGAAGHFLDEIEATNCLLVSSQTTKAKIVAISEAEGSIFVITNHDVGWFSESGTYNPVDLQLNPDLSITGGIAQKGYLWISTDEPDIRIIDLTTGDVSLISPLDSISTSLITFGAQIWSTMENNTAVRYITPQYIHSDVVDIVWQQNSLWFIDNNGRFCELTGTRPCRQLALSELPTRLARSNDESSIWIGTDKGTIWRLNLGNFVPEVMYRTSFSIYNLLEADSKYLWLSDGLTRLMAIDLQTSEQIDFANTFNVRTPKSLSYDGALLWFANSNPLRLSTVTFDRQLIRQLGPESNLKIEGDILDVQATASGIYIASPGVIYVIDPLTRQIIQYIGVDQNPTRIVVVDQVIWIVNNKNGFIYKIAVPDL